MKKPHNPFEAFEAEWAEKKKGWLRGSYTDDEIKLPPRRGAELEEPEPVASEPDIDPLEWFSHVLLVAAQGSGKTNLIRWRVSQILPFVREGKATLILLDPKDVLTRELPTLARQTGLADRTILIDPIEAPVSFDLFDKGDGSRAAIHTAIGQLIRLLNTITLGLQPFQRETLGLAVRALFATDTEPTFEKLFPILRNGKKALDTTQLDPNLRDIFENGDFKAGDNHVITRLNTFRNNPYFEPLVSRTAPLFNLAETIQQGKLILIKAGTQEPLYGKIWIEQIDRIIDARYALDEEDRTPTYVIIDEAQIFIGDNDSAHFADILDRAREARIGMFVACQHMGQIENSATRLSLYNSAIKFVARTNGDPVGLARAFAGELDANSFKSIPKYHFLFADSNMPQPELIKLPLVTFPKWRREDVRFFWRKQDAVPPAPARQPTGVTPTARPVPILEPPPETPQRRTLKPRK